MTALLDRWGIAYTCIKRKRESRFKRARGGAYRPASGVATGNVFDQNRHCTGAFSNGAGGTDGKISDHAEEIGRDLRDPMNLAKVGF
jgi:hypothetical protein